MREVFKSMAKGLAIFMVLCIVFTTIVLQSRQAVEANEAFEGIGDIISNNSETNPFKIVELVPDESMAELGYMAAGSEPVMWLNELAKISSPKEREDYIGELKSKLASIVSEDTSRAITYTSYDESYEKKNDQDWRYLDLANPETIAAGASGYRMDDLGPGKGDYEEKFDYVINTEGTGEFDQNVDYYIYGKGYYGVEFKAEATVVEGDKVVTSGERLYKAASSIAIVTQDKFDELLAATPNSYLYAISRTNQLGDYTCVESDLLKPVRLCDISFAELDTANYIYYTVQFVYVPDEELSLTGKYYKADKVQFFNGEDGEYGAHLNQEQSYVEAKNDSGNNIGHFDRSSDIAYINVGENLGNYQLVEDANGALAYPVIVDRIYYKGGFSNNNWLKYGVFNQGNYFEDDKDKNMYFEISTVVPGVLNEMELSSYDMLFISANSIINGQVKSFSKENDISWNKVISIVSAVREQFYPVVVDYSVLGDLKYNLKDASNLQKLVALLSSTNLDELQVTADMENDASFWNSLSINQDQDHHFVNGTIYVYPGSSKDDSAPFFFSNFETAFFGETSDTTEFENTSNSMGFGEIAEYINSQNLSRRTENKAAGKDIYGYFDLKLSKAIVLEYILSTANHLQYESDSVINVLDIEPCAATDASVGAINSDTILKWFTDKGYNITDVNVTHMTSSEFIGNIQDLADFDMIYMGLSTDKFNKVGGKTVYNDSSMDGLIYCNIGDVCVIGTHHSGLLYSDYTKNIDPKEFDKKNYELKALSEASFINQGESYAFAPNTYRYSGNDLTDEKVEDLEEFAKTGAPIIVADDFYKGSEVNDYYIDNSSKIYELMGTLRDYDNVITRTQVLSKISALYNYVELGRPELSIVKQATVEGKNYVALTSNKITFQFTISNKGTASESAVFDVILYLDVNADGKYSQTQERIAAADIAIYQNGEHVIPENDAYKLAAGTNHYELVYTLPESYIGIIPWKLKIVQNDNEFRYDYDQGYVYRKNAGDKQVINILQITQEDSSVHGSSFDMQAEMEDPNSKFSQLLEEVEDFELNIQTVSSNKYGEMYTDNQNILDQYDMLIIGFADCYEINDVNGSVEGIRAFIGEGKPVLFTHDTTSYFNAKILEGNSGEFGYYFNRKIRDVVGLDRYGVLSSAEVKRGNTVNRNTVEYNTIVEYAENNGYDVAYMPRSGKNVIVKQAQGMAYGDMVRYSSQLSSDYNKYFYLNGTVTARANGGYNFQMRTYYINRVNEGQITSYPFEIPENFSVAETHAQYYQLNMNEDEDEDGESDIVVWYTLDGGYNSEARINNIVYSASPKDVRNNYYIYTKGNVTYSGVGHKPIAGSENELKLYINTMIAAYSSGVHAPSISLNTTAEEDSPKLGTIYAAFNDNITEGLVEKTDTSVEQLVAGNNEATEDIYFTLADTNIVKNLKEKLLSMRFGVPVNITEEQYNEYKQSAVNKDKYMAVTDKNQNTVYLKIVDVEIYDLQGDKITKYLASNKTYRAKIPLSLLGDENYVEVYAIADTTFVRTKKVKGENEQEIEKELKPIISPINYDIFRIQRLGLTDLD